MRGRLTFLFPFILTAGTPAKVFVTNTLHLIDTVSIASTAGKTALCRQFYGYRVERFSGVLEVQNTDTFAGRIYIINSTANPTTSITNYPVQSVNPRCHEKMLGPVASGPSGRWNYHFSYGVQTVTGNLRALKGDVTFSGATGGAGVTTADPTDKVYMGIGTVASSGGSENVVATLKLTLDFVMWDPVPQVA